MPPPRGCGRAGTEAAEFSVNEMKIGKFRGHQAEVKRIACERLEFRDRRDEIDDMGGDQSFGGMTGGGAIPQDRESR
jgi:hypothetical protein